MATEHAPHQPTASSNGDTNDHYGRLAVMALLSFVSMYVLMYAMVDRLENVHANLNQAYMAGLMTAPMVAFEVLLMRGMYGNARKNAVVLAGSALALVAFFVLIRQQAGITDRQFLESMIPHHAGAILMCNEAHLEDPENIELCEAILSSQQLEIDEMKARLRRTEP
jgi:uncharacterized protein (DUF305 family)